MWWLLYMYISILLCFFLSHFLSPFLLAIQLNFYNRILHDSEYTFELGLFRTGIELNLSLNGLCKSNICGNKRTKRSTKLKQKKVHIHTLIHMAGRKSRRRQRNNLLLQCKVIAWHFISIFMCFCGRKYVRISTEHWTM